MSATVPSPPVDPAQLCARLRRSAALRLERITLVLAWLYLPVAASHWVFLERGRLVTSAVALGCAAALAVARRGLARRGGDAVGRTVALIYACVIGHSLVRLCFSSTHGDMMFVGVIAVALALVPSGLRFHAAAITGYALGWSTVILAAGGQTAWRPFVAPLLVAVTLSVVVRAIELGRERRIHELLLVDEGRREALRHEARHDALTGLANRVLFTERLEDAFARARASNAPEAAFAVLYLDLDRFKIVNDSLGHEAGDHLLCAIARRLEAWQRPGDLVARFGGDEFAVLLATPGGLDEALSLAGGLHAGLAEPVELDGHAELEVGASIGIAPFRADYPGVAAILRDADLAMYEAKRGGLEHRVFDHEMHARALERLELEVELRKALRDEALQVVYQPIVRLADGARVGVETLVRWHHPQHGWLEPQRFLPLAGETGQIVDVGRQVLRRACRDLARWRRDAPERAPGFVSVNLSARELADADLVAVVTALLDEHELPAGSLWLELTHGADDRADLLETRIASLNALGVVVCLGGFGGDDTTLGLLRRLPVGVLKLDPGFLVAEDDASEHVLEAVISLAAALGRRTVAQGVESPEQVELLLRLGCQLGQGYHLGSPVAAEVLFPAATDRVRA